MDLGLQDLNPLTCLLAKRIVVQENVKSALHHPAKNPRIECRASRSPSPSSEKTEFFSERMNECNSGRIKECNNEGVQNGHGNQQPNSNFARTDRTLVAPHEKKNRSNQQLLKAMASTPFSFSSRAEKFFPTHHCPRFLNKAHSTPSSVKSTQELLKNNTTP